MPLDKGKLQKLYSTLQQGGYSQSYDEFESGFTGNDNYPSRKKVYDLLTEHGADIGNSYEDFMGKMQAPSQPSQPQQQNTPAPAEPAPKPQPATKPNPRPKPRPKGGGMTAAERAQFIRNSQNIVSSSAAGIKHVKNQIDYANGNRGLKVSPVHLGQNSKVVRRHANGTVAKPHPVFDVAPEQQPGDTYLTESGNEFANRDKADTEQNAVDQYRYEQSETGQLNNAYAEAERLDKLLEQRGEKLEDENRDNWWRDLPRGGGGAVSTMNANDNNGRMTDTEYLNLLAARKKVDEQIRDLKAARDEKTGTFLGGLWRGFRDYAFDPSNWDNGYRDLLGTEAMLRAKTGAAQTPREKASERTMMEDTYKAGVAADNAEKVLGNGYSWMRIGAQSLPFALQFMAGNATGMIGGLTRSGEGMGVKLARKIAIKQGANNMMRNIGRSVLKNTGVMLGDLGAATALTTTIQAGQTGADIGQRYAGDVAYDPKTDDYKLEGGKSLGRSIYEGVANSTIENYTEQLGEHMHLGKYASSALTKMGLGRVSNWFTKVGKTDFMQGVNKYMEMAGFNGYPQEVMEEEVGMPLHAIFDGGNKMSDLLDGRQQLDIVGGMLFSMAGMGGASMVMQGGHKAAMAVQYHQDQHKLDNSDKVASFRLTADKWTPIKEEIDGTTNEEFGKVMKNVLSNDELSDQEKQAVWDYAQRLVIMRGHNIGQEAATRNGMTDKETNTANESYTQGYNTTDATAMNDAKNRLAVAQQKLDEYMEQTGRKFWEGKPSMQDRQHRNRDAQRILNEKWADGTPAYNENDKEYKLAQAVVNAQHEYEGMMQGVRDDIDDEVQQTAAIYDSRTNSNGTIQSATLKAQNPDGTDKKVYITSGNVVMTDDGKSVDNQKSDMSIVVVDEDGKVQMMAPDELFSLDTPIDGAQAKQQAIDAIQQSKAQEAADKINGKVNLTAGNTYTLTDNTGQQIEATIVADGQTGAVQNPDGTVNVSMNGKVVAMDVNTLQQMVDNTNMQRTAQGDEEGGQEQSTEQEGDQGILDQGGTVEPEGGTVVQGDEDSGAVPTYPGGVVAPDMSEPHQWQVDDTFTIDNGGIPVRGQVTGVGEDGVEIYTESPVNGKKMRVVSPEELQSMTTEVNGETVEAPEEDAAAQQTTEPSLTEQSAINETDGVNGSNGVNVEQPQAQAKQAQPQQTEGQPARAIDRIPHEQIDDGKGNVRTVHNWNQADPGDTYDALTEIYHGNAERVKKGIDNRVGNIDKAIKGVQKQMDSIDNSDDFDEVAAQSEQYDQLQQQKDELEKQKKYWQGVQMVPRNRKMDADRRSAEEQAAAKAAQEKSEAEAAEKARQEREQVNGVPDVVDDIMADARKRGFRNVNGMVVNRQGETHGVSGRDSNVKFSSTDTAKGHIKVIDADELQPSHVSGHRNPSFFIDEAQPKDRTDTVSGMVAAKIAADLNPEEITGDGSAYQFSAPTVNSRGEVIQGNNRSDALKLMYSNPAFKPAQDAYKQYIADHAEEFGFTPEDVAKIMQMEHPVMVNELDVPDDEAIRLGQMRASDNESGGIERIDPVTTSQKLGGKVSSFANVLLSSPDEDASLSDVLMQNGAEAVKWLRTHGAISDTAAQSAFDKKGNLTTEARMDLQNILKQSLFQGGVSDLPTMFDKIPAKAQKAILSTFMRDFDSAESERILPEIQRAIEAWYGCAMSNEAFAKASNYKGAKNAMHDWERQTKMLDDNMPSDKFSNFARELACRLQGCGMRETQQSLNDYFDLVQGKSQGDLFGGKMGEQADRQESIRRIFNIEYKPISNNNGKTRSNAVADNSSQSGEGQQGSPTDGKGRKRAESGSGPANGAGGTENHDEEGIKATHPSEDSSHSIGSTSSSEKKETERQGVNTEPTEKQKEAGNYKKGHIKVDGYDITIENPKDSTRSGKDASGKAWSVPMHYDYGYIKGTEGVDGDHIDVYLSDNPTSGNVYVVDQVDQKTGKFDEHKVMYGFPSKEAAVEAYKGQYEKGWKVGTVTEVSREDFKKWVESSKRKTKPFSEYNSVKEAAVDQQPTKQNASTERTEHNQKRTTTKGKTENHKKANVGQFGLVSDERMEELKKRLRAKLNNLNMGVDPEVLAIGLELAAGYIDRGVKKFADYSKAMINDLGDVVRPYLKAFYNGVRDMPEITSNGLDAEMDDYETVSKFNVATIGKDGEDTKPSILDTAEQVSNESHVERAASNVSDEDVKSEQKENTRYSERGFTLRPATEEDVEKNMPIYVDGKRTHIVMLVRKGEQVGAAQFSKPVIEAVYTTDNERVPLSKIEVEEVPINALSGKKTSSKENNEKKKAISSQQDPSLFDDLFEGEEASAKQPTEQKATEQTSGQGTAEQQPAVITTDDEKGKEKPVETKPEKELTGDSKEYQKRAKAEQEFVERIKGMITEAANDGRSLTMSDIKRAYNDELDGNWQLPNDYKDTDLQELVERAMTLATREVAQADINKDEQTKKAGFDEVVRLYQSQPSLNSRDSSRVAHQQYSTPTPFGYVMDMFMMGGDKKPLKLLEPSAGNGALTIGIPAPLWHVNDIDERRLINLRSMPYGKITNQDGTMPFEPKAYDAVATNPPFGSTQEKEFDGGRTKISSLEGLMAINALASMKDDGRAAIIIGGNTQYMSNGAMQAKDMKLFKYLYTHYNVVDVINLDGDMYKRNGTGYNVRMILIAGRKTDVGDNPEKFTYPPVKKKARAEQVKTFDELYKRVENDIQQAKQMEREPSAAVNSDGSQPVNNASERTGNSEAAGGVQQQPVRAGEMERRPQPGRSVRPSSAQDGRGNGERIQHESSDRLDNADGRNAGSNHAVQGNRPSQGQSSERREVGSTGRGTVGGDQRGGTSERNNTNGERPKVVNNAEDVPQRTEPHAPQAPSEKVELGQEKVAYPAKSQSMTLQSRVPAAQAEAIADNLDKLGDVDEMVRSELGYSSKDELYSHLAAEQIDSVALAINQMKHGKGFIIGDMTGVGKGRQGAALIRWAIKQGKTPIYFTQKARLYTDNYRDMCDIGSKGLRPFLIASNDDGNIVENVVDENGEKVYDKNGEPVTRVVYGLPKPKERERVYDYILQNGKLPPEYDYVLVTYSQIQSGTKTYEIGNNGEIEVKDKKYKGKTPGADKNGDIRRDVLEKLAKDNYVFLDESHTVGGQSSSGLYMQDMLKGSEGVTYLSATFAKRPDNMPLYAMKTAMSESDLSQKDMIDAIQNGGVTLQEIMSKQLVQSGQMIRRERDYSGVSIDWEGVDEETDQQQRAQFDEVAKIFNAIREFQDNYVDQSIEKMSEDMAEEGMFSKKTQGTSHMGVNNVPFASKMYNLVNQLLFSLKANAVADKAIEYLKKGEKPVISFNNTMEGFLDDMPRNTPMPELPNFSLTLMRALEGTLRYTEGEIGNKDNQVNKTLNINDLGDEAVAKYNEIRKTILNLSIGLPIDPMDAIKMRIEAAGYKVGEITGRKSEMVKDAEGNYIVQSRSSKEMDGKAAASAFNSASGKNGGLDVLLINKSGSTGISLHASSKFTDQSPRAMIAAQFQSDINDEVQMRGRIDRTGQVHRGRYIYLVSSIPAEQRLQMMFKNKLKSLDANTTSSQKSKFNDMEVTDFMNKYGDEVTWSYMIEHPDLEERLGDPLNQLSDESKKDNRRGDDEDSNPSNDCAGKILRRLPFLSVNEQEQIFNDLAEAYKVKLQILNDAGENDLEITTMPLRAEPRAIKVWKQGSDPDSGNAFADNTYLETAEVDVLKKPMKANEVREYADRLTDGKPWEQWHEEQHEAVEKFYADKAKAVEDKAKADAQKRIDKAREDYIKGCLKARNKGDNNWSDEEISHMADIAAKEAADKEQTKINNRYISIDAQRDDVLGALDAFTPLEPLIIPMNLKDTITTVIPSLGTFLGIKFGKGYSRSSSTAVFATLDGRRKIEVPLSDKTSLDNIKHQSLMLGYQARGLSMDNWDSKVPTKSRKTAYIVTGNLMQALVDTQKSPETKGQLISYTTIDGDVKQGILMNDRFKEEDLKTSIPISSMMQKIIDGDAVESADKEVKIERGMSYHYNDFKLSVPKSKSRGGKYFLDRKLLRLLDDEFTTSGSNMTAWVSQQNLKKVLDYLSKTLGVTVQVKANLEETADSPHNDEPATPSEAEEGGVLYREVADEEAARLDSEPEKVNAGQASRPSYEEWMKGKTRRREGRGAYSDEELSLMNDPVAKWLGKSNRTKAQQEAFANRKRKNMEASVKRLAKILHLDNVNIVMDTSTLKGRKSHAKGFYDRNTNEITIVIPNHRDVEDVMQTLLHEGVAHYGLRKMFGSHFDTFLDNVYAAADNDVRRRITELALSKYGGDFRVATEEYLASLAEQTDFEHMPETFWQKIKDFFLDMLHAIGFADFANKYDFTLSDNELRYILWRSYENLKEPGRYRSILGEAEDVAKQTELQVGNYSEDSEDRQDSPSEAAESREDAIKRLTQRLVNTFKSWAKARNAFDEAFEKDPDGERTLELGDELNNWNDLMDAAKDVSMEHGIYLGELLRDNGISGDDLEKYDDMFGGRAAGEPQAWGKRDMLSRAEQVSHGVDPQLLFRDTIEDDDNTARETYNRMADEAKSRIREAWQDSMINVRNLQQAVLEQRGEKLEDYEDAYNADNRSHGKSRAESEYFTDNLYKPLLKAVDEVAKAAKVSIGDVTEYMMAKHGLERNIVFARRDADAAYKKAYDEAKGKYDALMNASRAESDPKKADALEKAANKVKFPDYDDIFNHLRMRDYAGLTSLTGQSDVQDAEAEAKRIVADMESRAINGVNGGSPIDELWKATNAATKWTLKKGYESGIISKDNYNYVSGMFNYYVPLRGWQEDTAGDLFDYVGSGDNGTAFSPTLHKANGRRSEADNPIAYIGNMAVSSIVQCNKNKVKQTFLGFVENHPTNLVTVSEMWYRNFGTDTDPDWREDVPNIPEDATADEVADIVQQHEDLMEQLKDLGKATKQRGRLHLGVPVKKGQALEHHVEVMVNGKKYVLYINGNPRAAQALNGTRQRRSSERSFESSKIARMGRLLAERYTSLSPSFTVSNALRDLTMAAITTLIKESPAYALRFRLNVAKLGGPLRMFTLMKWYKKATAQQLPTGQMSDTEKYFYEFMSEGSETGFTSLKEIDEYKKDMDKMYRNMNQKLLNPKRLFRGFSQGLEYANRCIEDMTRFAIYMSSRQSGRNVKRSVNDAKNITLNFNRKGSGELGNATYRNLQIFVNPAIQSLQNVGKMAKDHPVRFNLLTGSIALIGAAQVFATQLLWSVFGGGDGDDDYWNAVDEYWKLPSWQRRNNLVIWIPGTKNFAMIPLAQEFRVFHGFGETMTTVMEGKSGKNPALEVLTQTSDLLPLDFAGNNGNPLVNLAPTVTQPLLQVGFNTDFTGRPLYKDNDFNKYEPSFQKAYVGTPSWLIKSSEMINDLTGGDEHKQGWLERTKVGKELNNPAVVDHILKGYYGGLYSFFAQLGGTMLTLGTGNMPDAQEVPVVNRVITATRKTEQGGKQKLPDWYYDLLEENDRQQNEFSGYKKDYMKGDADGQRKFNELIKGKDFQKWQKVNTYIGAVQQIRTAMNYTKDPKEKAELKQNLDEVLGELNKMKDE